MACSNCYNNCPEIVSDKCVKYTGIDVPVLGIQNGDSLSYVEQSLIEFLTSAIDGTGIKIDIPQQILCNLIKKYLPTCGDLTVVNLFETLIQAVCDLQTQVTANTTSITTINNQISTIEGSYNIGCLTGVTSTSGTHAIVQALITKLCAFITEVSVTYVKISDVDAYIQNYITTSNPDAGKFYTKMIPYVAVPYFGTISGYFDSTGVGLDNWEKIYICNGANGTPDLRGRVTVGVNDGTGGGGALNPIVNPSDPTGLVPSYSSGAIVGTNYTTLTVNQIPNHDHENTISVSDKGHFTTVKFGGTSGSDWKQSGGSGRPLVAIEGVGTAPSGVNFTATTSTKNYADIESNIVNGYRGGGLPHTNVQPGIGCYYIMYIP